MYFVITRDFLDLVCWLYFNFTEIVISTFITLITEMMICCGFKIDDWP
jgi:hypothetical protein